MWPNIKINTNRWNKIRYTLYAPGYNVIGRVFSDSRKKSIQSLDIKHGENILFIGIGTGLDLEYIPKNCVVTATDITPAMISITLKRNESLGLNLKALVMDGQQLQFPDQSFDKIILHLILAVIPDPIACINECQRVLKHGGNIIAFDKFAPKDQPLPIWRVIFNPIVNLLFSSLTRKIENIISGTTLIIESDLNADLNGNFRIIKLKKP